MLGTTRATTLTKVIFTYTASKRVARMRLIIE